MNHRTLPILAPLFLGAAREPASCSPPPQNENQDPRRTRRFITHFTMGLGTDRAT